MTRFKTLFPALAIAMALFGASAAHAVGVCDPTAGNVANCVKPNADGSINTSGNLPNQVYTYTFTRPANVTAYASGQIIANSTTAGSVVPISFPNVVSANGGCLAAFSLRLRFINSGTGQNVPSISVALYNTAPTFAAGDGGTIIQNVSGNAAAQFNGNMASNLNSSDGAMVYSAAQTVPVCAAAGSRTLYMVPYFGGAFTPTSGETIIAELVGHQ